jgi:hypothetical protein
MGVVYVCMCVCGREKKSVWMEGRKGECPQLKYAQEQSSGTGNRPGKQDKLANLAKTMSLPPPSPRLDAFSASSPRQPCLRDLATDMERNGSINVRANSALFLAFCGCLRHVQRTDQFGLTVDLICSAGKVPTLTPCTA